MRAIICIILVTLLGTPAVAGPMVRKNRKEHRQNNRKERKEQRQENRAERKENRQDNREERKEQRQENRQDRKEARQSNRQERRQNVKESLQGPSKKRHRVRRRTRRNRGNN